MGVAPPPPCPELSTAKGGATSPHHFPLETESVAMAQGAGLLGVVAPSAAPGVSQGRGKSVRKAWS